MKDTMFTLLLFTSIFFFSACQNNEQQIKQEIEINESLPSKIIAKKIIENQELKIKKTSDAITSSDVTSIKLGHIPLLFAYYTAPSLTADGNLRWYISATSGSLNGYIFSLGNIETINGIEKVSWREVSNNAASVNVVNETVTIGNITDNLSYDFLDWGLGVQKHDPSIQEDIELIRNTSVNVLWWFFQASNGSWFIIDKQNHIYKFETSNGEYDWQQVDTSTFQMNFYIENGIKKIKMPEVVATLEKSTISVSESRPTGSIIGNVTITNSGDSAISAMRLEGSNANHFSIATNGVISTATLLDYESISEYNLTAIATNQAGDSIPVSVDINLSNEMDTVPSLATPTNSSFQEDIAIGTTIVTVLTNGTNPEANITDSFSIVSGNTDGDFNISNTGVISTIHTLNVDRTSNYVLVVKASNSVGDSATVNVDITITNVANIVPILVDTTLSIEENASVGLNVGELTITTAGDSPISAITLSGTGYENFEISNDGNITIKTGASLDYETTTEYNLTAIATNIAGNSNSVKLDINMINVIDHVPLLSIPTNLELAENLTIGTNVLTIELNGTTPDENVTDSFDIIAGDINHDFAISNTGVISVAKALNASVTPNYTLTIYAVNQAGESIAVNFDINITSLTPLLADESAQIYDQDINITALTFTNTGGVPASCTSTPTLPIGLSVDVNESSCQITGKPTKFLVNQTYTITATNSDGESNATIDIMVKTALPLLIVRIEYNDYQFVNDATTWNSKIYGSSDTELNHYFNEISYGSFQFQPAQESDGVVNDGIVTVRFNKNHPDPRNDAVKREDYRNIDMVDALNIADTVIDFSIYDKNANGKISIDELQIMFLVAGGESATGTNPGVWAHASGYYQNDAPIYDGVKVMSYFDDGRYSIFGERHGTHDATMGIIAHELGHAVFQLPDLYDTSGASEGIGNFGLMGGGNWTYKNGDSYSGQTPIHMTGWSKSKIGFAIPTLVDNNLSNLSLKGTSFVDYNLLKIKTNRINEYFLLENRSSNGYDRGFYALEGIGEYLGGLLLLHIDENQASNRDVTHKLVDVEEANSAGLDTKTNRGHYNNLFFSGNSASFTATTTPNSQQYDGNNSGINVNNISNVGDIMTLDIEINAN